jgi:Phage major capsid protein E.
MTIFDLVQAQEITAYWEELVQDEAPYPCEELFPDDKKRGLKLSWLKGSRGLPVVLKTSAFDVHAIPRPRIGFEKLSAEMPYFKESMYIDEELRQELNMVLETGNQAYIDAVMNRIFDDEMQLLRAARASRERMRMMALTTGVVSMANNGQAFTYDYQVPANHKVTVSTSWSTVATADPIEDMRKAKELIADETGAVLTRAMCDGVTWRNIRNNVNIQKKIYVLSNGVGSISDDRLRQYILDEVGITVVVNDKRYMDENENTLKFMPSNTFVMFPDGALGKTWFGTTPAESDLMTSNVANVSITDTGVAVTTVQKADPVNVETIVSQICLPSFPEADKIYILDTEA